MMKFGKISLLFFLMSFGFNSSAQSPIMLIARNTGMKILSTGDTIRTFGFATSLSAQPNIPGPTIYGNEGDSVIIDLFNVSQGAPHTIHLHGLDVDQQNDGVGMLSFEVHHMDHGFYRFKAPHPGTYLYHCHVTSPIHVQAGMYGLVIIKPSSGSDSTWSGGYAYHKDISYLMSEIDTVWHRDSVLDHAHDTTQALMYAPIPDYSPDFFLVNGLSDQQLNDSIELNTSVGEVNYIRLSNLGFYYNRVIFPSGLNAQIIDTDGRPLPQVQDSDTVIVFPGERYGVLAEAQSQFTDSILIEYVNMNTDQVMGEQFLLVNVNGFYGTGDRDDEPGTLQLFPNPNNGNFYLNYASAYSEKFSISIYDINGKVVFEKENQKAAGAYHENLSLSFLTDGIYLITVKSERGLIHEKYIKTR